MSPCLPTRNAVSSRLQPHAGAGRRCPHRTASPSPSAAPASAAPRIFRKSARRLYSRRDLSPPPAPEVQRALRPRRQNPHRSRPPNQPQPPRGFLLGRLSNAGPTSRITVWERAGVRKPSPFRSFPAASRTPKLATPDFCTKSPETLSLVQNPSLFWANWLDLYSTSDLECCVLPPRQGPER